MVKIVIIDELEPIVLKGDTILGTTVSYKNKDSTAFVSGIRDLEMLPKILGATSARILKSCFSGEVPVKAYADFHETFNLTAAEREEVSNEEETGKEN